MVRCLKMLISFSHSASSSTLARATQRRRHSRGAAAVLLAPACLEGLGATPAAGGEVPH
jgi:hypothetical protein